MDMLINVSGIIFLSIIAIFAMGGFYGIVLLPVIEAFSLCRCWRAAYGPQPWKDWPHILRISLSYAKDHAYSPCIESYHTSDWYWEGVGKWNVTKVVPLRIYDPSKKNKKSDT
ncbi:hypothetical protein BAU67_001929 [Escherichia coli]|nr:hypothetical protein [Escherichia coli]